MIKIKKCISAFVLSLTGAAFMACSSGVKYADIPSTANPQDEIAKFDVLLSEAVSKNIDVLAPNEFRSAVKFRDEAKSDSSSGEKQKEILDDVREGRGFLNKAYQVSEGRMEKAPGLFGARQMALKAGAGNRPELKSDLKSLDSDISDKAEDLSNMSAEKIAKYQEQYVDLERRAVIFTQLGDSQAKLNGAKNDGATKRAPMTYKKSEISLKNAESVISTNVRNPNGFQSAVLDANSDVALLMSVMNTIKQNKNLSEPAAIKMVSQSRQIKNLKSDLVATNAANVEAEISMAEKNAQLNSDMNSQQKELSSAENSVRIQEVLEKARAQFSAEEAEAYQQGKTLLIRLKKINFASGRSDLPEGSFESLAKVKEVAKLLNASEIRVEGHTDSIGNESQNKSISEQRASAVASYFKSNGFDNIEVQSVGFGFQKPIATNKSKQGRAQNRRVDIVITPEAPTSAQ